MLAVFSLPHVCAAQATWLERRAELSEFEGSTDAVPGLDLRIVDDRRFQENAFPLSPFEEIALALASGDGELIAEADALTGTLTVGYYGLYRTRGGTWGARFFGDLAVAPAGRAREPIELKISEDQILGDEPKGSELQFAQRSLDRALERKLRDSMAEVVGNTGSMLREVTAFGRASRDSAEPEASLDAAVLDALRRGVELALGVEIASTVTVQDFGGAEVETVRRGSGVVRAWQVMDEFTAETDDGYLTVLVRALLVQPGR